MRDSFMETAQREDAFAQFRAAIAAKDADALYAAVTAADAQALTFNRETLWRMTAAADDQNLLNALWRIDQTRRDPSRLMIAAWHGTITGRAYQSYSWIKFLSNVTLSIEEEADLAGRALGWDMTVAHALIEPVLAMPPVMQARKTKLLVDYLHAAAGHDAGVVIHDVMTAHFPHGQTTFSVQTKQFQAIAMRAVVTGSATALGILLNLGAEYLSDAHLDEMLVAAADRGQATCAQMLTGAGASPISIDGAAMRYLGRQMSATDAGATAEDLLSTLITAGGDPSLACQQINKTMTGDKADALCARVMAVAGAHQAQVRDHVMQTLRQPGHRRPDAVTYRHRHESVLHSAARHGILADMIAAGQISPPTTAEWRMTNAAGQSVMDLARARAIVAPLLTERPWRNRMAGLNAFLDVLPAEAATPGARAALMQQARQMADAARAASRKYRL